ILAIGFALNRPQIRVPNSPDELDQLVGSLLNNIYHAFDFRDESKIYDVLERSIDGPLLEKVYLETKAGLELESQGGPRVKINGIDLRSTELTGADEVESTFQVQAEWVAVGNVNHWGHEHLRANKYKANLDFVGVEGQPWQVASLDLLEEERTKKVNRSKVSGTK
ncbi:MAG: hypothetical protein AAF226_17850, partial [Verrucomicrobiota bacterium]